MSGGFCPGGFCPGGFCPGGFWFGGILSGGILARRDFVLGGFWLGGFCPGGFCPGGFRPGGFCPGGFCPRTVYPYLTGGAVTTIEFVLHCPVITSFSPIIFPVQNVQMYNTTRDTERDFRCDNVLPKNLKSMQKHQNKRPAHGAYNIYEKAESFDGDKPFVTLCIMRTLGTSLICLRKLAASILFLCFLYVE